MATTNNASFSFRLPAELKQQSFDIIEKYGFTPSQVFNLFLTEIAKTKTVPLNLSYLKPNETTLRAMQEAESGELEIIHLAEDESIAQALLSDLAKE
ncbi:antitoxin [Pasteurellaceae bacterium Orientalotternb1]|nr:antitoxin [Pasteurellaceae bacterium Orientalotternb1]